MKKHLPVLLALGALLFVSSTGCVTAMKQHANGDFSQSVNVVTKHPPEGLTILINDKPADQSLVYDGSKNDSPFYVYRCKLASADEQVKVTMKTKEGQALTKVAGRQSESACGSFAMGGLFVFIDVATGALRYYDDVHFE